ADGHDNLVAVPLDHVLDKRADPRAEVHQAFAAFAGGRHRGKRPLAAPIVAVLRQVVAGPRRVVGTVVADFAQAVIGDDFSPVCLGYVGGRFLGALHGAGIERVDRFQLGRQPRAQRGGLAVAQLGKARVPVTAIPLFQINITLPVANKIQVHNQLDSKDLFVLYLKWSVMPTLARGTPGFSMFDT